jgi:hypothetical protein
MGIPRQRRFRIRALKFIAALPLLFFCPTFPSVRPARFRLSPAFTSLPPARVSLTFVTVPKPQLIPDQIEMAMIVLRVWLTYPFTRVLMFTTPSEYDPTNQIIPFVHSTFGASRLVFGGNMSLGYERRPLIKDWFTEGFRLVKTGFIAFINGDIIVTPLWMNAAMATFDAFGKAGLHKTMIYGTRTDVQRRSDVFYISRESPRFVWELVRWLEKNTRCNNPYGMDLVLVHSSFDVVNWGELPGFVVGMCVWDNYFMGWANHRANTVTMDFGPKVFHVDHPPNACNDQNYGYFRHMSYGSRYFAGFQEHHQANWKVKIEEGKLWGRMRREAVTLRKPVDDSIQAEFS